jgi:hypothetical protein
VSTEQVLHVDKWEAHEPPLAVDDPSFAALGAGWTVAEGDTYGELGVRLSFGEWVGAAHASRIAAAWGGDRGVLVKNGSAYAFAWRIRYDEAKSKPVDAYASRALAEIVPAIEKLGSHGSGPKGFACVERGELGPLAVGKRGRDLVVVAGPANVSSKGWTSAGHCPKARAWVEEIESR